MANKHIKELSIKLKEYFNELNLIDSEVIKISSQTMVDPEDWEEITGNLRKLSLHLANVNSVLAMALDSKDFSAALASRRVLVNSIRSFVERVKSEQPDSTLIGEYELALVGHLDTLKLLEEVNRFRSFPKAHKKFIKWAKKGLIDLEFTPFTTIDESIASIRRQLKEGEY